MQALGTTVPLLTSMKDGLDWRSMQGYEGEDILDIVSEVAPKVTLLSTNPRLVKMIKEEGKSPADLLDSALNKI